VEDVVCDDEGRSNETKGGSSSYTCIVVQVPSSHVQPQRAFHDDRMCTHCGLIRSPTDIKGVLSLLTTLGRGLTL